MRQPECRQTAAWIFLVAATLLSFWASAHLVSQMGWIAAIMAVAAAKVIAVLRYFMDFDRLAVPLKLYFLIWTIGCGVMIFGVACLSGGSP